MNTQSNYTSLVEADREISQKISKVSITGTTLSLSEIYAIARFAPSLSLTSNSIIRKRIDTCYKEMIRQVEEGIPIYGCNTGYGARASIVLNHGTAKKRLELAKKISESIAHTDVTVGPELGTDIVRAAMAI